LGETRYGQVRGFEKECTKRERERENGEDRKTKRRDTENAEEELHEKETEKRHAPPCTSLRFPSWAGACE
jgi:hypothetical protein